MMQEQCTQEQIIGILPQAGHGAQSVATHCREAGIAEVTFYRWRKKYGRMTVAQAQRRRELERENARLKRLLAERDLERDAPKESCSQNSSEAARAAPGGAVPRRARGLGAADRCLGGGESGAAH